MEKLSEMTRFVLYFVGDGCGCKGAGEALDLYTEVDFFAEYPDGKDHKYFFPPTVSIREKEDYMCYRLKGFFAPFASAEETDTIVAVLNIYKTFDFDSGFYTKMENGRAPVAAMTYIVGGVLKHYKKVKYQLELDMENLEIVEHTETTVFVDDISKRKLDKLKRCGAVIKENIDNQGVDGVSFTKITRRHFDPELLQDFVQAYYEYKARENSY